MQIWAKEPSSSNPVYLNKASKCHTDLRCVSTVGVSET